MNGDSIMAVERIDPKISIELYKLSNIMMREAQNYLDKICSDTDKLTCVNGWILRFLYNNRGHDVFQRDVEKEFSITRSTASKIIRLMESKGLVESGSVPGDARLKKLRNTEKAKIYREIMRKETNFIEGKMLKDFSVEEIQQLNSFLQRMYDNLNT